MKNEQNYSIELTQKIQLFLDNIDSKKIEIDEKKPLRLDVWQTIQNKLRIDWTYDSNAIEGSTLTRGETMFFLQEGLTVEGKPFKDFLDAKNHAQAIDFLFDVIKNKRPLSESLIKEMNALLLSGVSDTPAVTKDGQKVKKPATPGQYKQNPNHVQQLDGTIHYYTEPLKVVDEMGELVSWINNSLSSTHTAIVAAVCHYHMVRIHPFDDGNGRGARLLMNLMLMQEGYPPAIIRHKDRRQYITCLNKADFGDIASFVEFVLLSLQQTQEVVLLDLSK